MVHGYRRPFGKRSPLDFNIYEIKADRQEKKITSLQRSAISGQLFLAVSGLCPSELGHLPNAVFFAAGMRQTIKAES
jgi:hypothetical protein